VEARVDLCGRRFLVRFAHAALTFSCRYSDDERHVIETEEPYTTGNRTLKMEKKMKRLLKKMILSCSALVAFAAVIVTSPAADAGEYCTLNNSYMRSCGYDSMEQCQAMLSGRDGTCMRDPFAPAASGAFASVQEHHAVREHHHHHHRHH
jgi:hypothetical protein